MVTPVAPRNVNDVSYVTRINHQSWHAQYLVRLECRMHWLVCAVQMTFHNVQMHKPLLHDSLRT